MTIVTGYRADVEKNCILSGDEIGIDFNKATNLADLPVSMISKAQLEAVFRFSMNIGRDFVGRWLNSKSLRITILNATKEPSSQLFHPPSVGLGGLTVSILESGFYFLSFFGLLTFCLPPPLLSIFPPSSASSALSGLWGSDRIYSGMRCNYSFFLVFFLSSFPLPIFYFSSLHPPKCWL